MIRLKHLAKASLVTALLLVLSTGNTEQQSDVPAGMGARADVDRPKPTFMLHERDKRVHGLKPFQDLVDPVRYSSRRQAITPGRSPSTSH